MNNFWIMLSHAYFSKLKSKSFIITTAITAVGILVIANIETIIKVFDDGEMRKDQVAVIDETDVIYPLLKEEIQLINENIELELTTEAIDILEADVEEGLYEGILILKSGENGSFEAVYKSTSLTGSQVTASLQASLQHIQTSFAAQELDLTMGEIARLNAPVLFTNEAIVEGAKSEEELNQARGIVYILLFFIYFSVIMYSSMIATDVATEKSSRVMEIIISSVSPVKQMFAKIIGIGLVGLTQMIVLLLVGYFSLKSSQDLVMGGFLEFFGFGELSATIIFYAVVFFLLGYFLLCNTSSATWISR
ncbi:ABC transporter permease [Halalkalibacter akibai]|uniref:ABC transporter n=1 Tax=Halalkalibacter akibai (strain ATCC 43226 / DSM 21942 / CIP 109018 / JCM 9157 / 1139) TaxID=1236973 RepID=W4QY05_HALA3|nr:ABC transporter [Halalkalibacter akibai JCM 9157]